MGEVAYLDSQRIADCVSGYRFRSGNSAGDAFVKGFAGKAGIRGVEASEVVGHLGGGIWYDDSKHLSYCLFGCRKGGLMLLRKSNIKISVPLLPFKSRGDMQAGRKRKHYSTKK